MPRWLEETGRPEGPKGRGRNRVPLWCYSQVYVRHCRGLLLCTFIEFLARLGRFQDDLCNLQLTLQLHLLTEREDRLDDYLLALQHRGHGLVGLFDPRQMTILAAKAGGLLLRGGERAGVCSQRNCCDLLGGRSAVGGARLPTPE